MGTSPPPALPPISPRGARCRDPPPVPAPAESGAAAIALDNAGNVRKLLNYRTMILQYKNTKNILLKTLDN